MILDDGELVNCMPLVILQILVIDQTNQVAFDCSIGSSIFDLNPINEHPMEHMVVAN